MSAKIKICATCGTGCQSIKTPAECAECGRRRQAGDFWSPDELTDGDWVPKGGVVVWQPWPEKRARVAKCGTDSGYYRHLRRTGTPACGPCKAAHSRAEMERQARAQKAVA